MAETLERYVRGLSDRVADVGMQAALWDRDWAEEAREAVELLAAEGLEFSADDLHERVGSPSSNGALGAVFQTAARDGLIRLVGYRRSRRLSRRGSVVGVWVGVPAEGGP